MFLLQDKDAANGLPDAATAEADLAAATAHLVQNPMDEQAWFRRGDALERLQKSSGAHEAFLFATQIAPSWAEAWYRLGKVRRDIANFEEMLPALEKAYQLGGTGAALAVDLGNARSMRGQEPAALQAFEEAVRRDPTFEDGHYWRATTLIGLRRPQDAVVALDYGLKACPQSYKLFVTKARALARMGDRAGAMAQLDRAVAAAPNEPRAWEARGGALQEFGAMDLAMAAYEKSVTLTPPPKDRPAPSTPQQVRAHALFWVALGYLRQGRDNEALAIFDEALRLSPEDDEAWFNRGETLRGLKRYAEAFEALDYAARARPNEPQRWAARGTALARLGRVDEAIASYDYAVSVAKDKWTYLQEKAFHMPTVEQRMAVMVQSLKEGGQADRSLADAMRAGIRAREAAARRAQPAATPACPRCRAPLEWIAQYGRWYCRNESQYV